MGKKSDNIQEKALKLIPGMTQLLSKRPDLYSLGVWPAYYKRAKGVEIWDLDGNQFVDMSIGGIGANILGYCDPDVDAAVLEAIKNGSSSTLNCYEEVELAELLCDLHPWADMVRYARTGGEAMTIAVRIARAHTKRDVVAFCGYHGWHDWYLSANLSHDSALDGHLIPGLSPLGVPRGLTGTAFPFSYNHLEELKQIVSDHGKKLAGIVMEPIRNFKPAPGFIEGVRQIANETGAVMIVDEISAGFRFNTGGAHLEFFPDDCMPDMAVFSKSLGNGYPMAAILGIKSVMQSAQDSFISSTYWTERIGPCAAIAMIKKHREKKVAQHLIKIGSEIQKGWSKAALANGFNIEIGGIKPMSHFSFNEKNEPQLKALLVQKMLERGFLATNGFYAMYAHTKEHVSAYLKAIEQTFCELRELIDLGQVDRALKGKPAVQGFTRIA